MGIFPRRTGFGAAFLLTLLLLPAYLLANEPAPSPGWQALLDNRPEDALVLLDAEIDASTDATTTLRLLEGKRLAAEERGQTDLAWESLLAQARLASGMEDSRARFFLERLTPYASDLNREPDLFDFALTLEEDLDTLPSAAARVIRQILARGYGLRREYDALERMQTAPGSPTLLARVVGPFASHTPHDLDEPLPLESDPAAATYRDALGQAVPVAEDIRVDRDGRFPVSEVLRPTPFSDMVYTQHTLVADAPTEVVLRIGASHQTKVWLNGWLVYHPSLYQHAYRHQNRSIEVRFQEGTNTLLLKHSRLHSGVEWLAPDGAPLEGITERPWNPEDWADATCRQTRGVLLSRPHTDPVLDLLTALPAGDPAPALWQAEARETVRELYEARLVWEGLVARYPESAVLLVGAGHARMREARGNIDSRERLRKEATDLFREARTHHPESHGALLETGRHFADSDQERQALRALDALLALYPDSEEGRIVRGGVYRKKGWTGLATQDIEHVTARPGLRLLLANHYSEIGETERAFAIEQEEFDAGRLWSMRWFRVLLERGRFDEASTLLEEFAVAFPREIRRLRALRVQLAEASGDTNRLRSLLEETFADHVLDYRTAERLGDLAIREGRTADAVRWLQESADIRQRVFRTDPELLRRIRRLEGGDWPLAAYLTSVPDAERERVIAADHPRANYATMLRLDAVRLHEDGSHERLTQHAVKVFDPDGIRHLGELSVPTESDNLLFCRTVQPDGTVQVPVSVENLDLKDATSMYNVQPGSMLEYAYRSQRESFGRSGFSDRFFAEDGNTPVIHARYVLLVPRSVLPRLSIRVFPDDFTPTMAEEGDIVIFSWEARDIQGRRPEHFLPLDEPSRRSVHVTMHPEGEQRITHFFQAPDPIHTSAAIRAKARELTEGVEGVPARARRLWTWVAQSIEDGREARTARDTFLLRSGSREARLRLYQAMLAAVGIQSDWVAPNRALSTPGQGTRRMRAERAGHFGGEPLLRIHYPEAADEWVTMYSHSRNYRFGDLPEGMIGAHALLRGTDAIRLVQVGDTLHESGADDTIVIALQEDGSAALVGSVFLHGTLAGHLRNQAQNPQYAKQVMEGIFTRQYPTLQIESIQYPSGDALNPHPDADRDPFVLRIRGRFQAFSRREGERLSFRAFEHGSGTERFLTEMPRDTDFDLSRDMITGNDAVYIAPPGWAFADVPANLHIRTPFGLYIADYHVDGDRLSASRVLILPTQRVEKDQYPALARFLTDIRNSEDRGIRLVRLPETVLRTDFDCRGATDAVAVLPYQRLEWPTGTPRPDSHDNGEESNTSPAPVTPAGNTDATEEGTAP